jgi:hypothetical protein
VEEEEEEEEERRQDGRTDWRGLVVRFWRRSRKRRRCDRKLAIVELLSWILKSNLIYI